MTTLPAPAQPGAVLAATRALPPPLLAAVTLDVQGGGIAAVSRMTRRALAEAWPTSRLVTLYDVPVGPGPTRPGLSAQLRFGVNVLRRQVSSAEGWILFNHLALAQAQAFVPRSFRRPYVVFLHGIEAWQPLPPSGRRALDGAALLIANSHHTAARVRAANPGPGAIHVCQLALDPQTIGIAADHERGSRRGRGEPLVLMVGRLVAAERYKGHDQVIEAWPVVRARVPDARLCIVGGGDDRERLRAKAAALGLADAVEFTGYVSDDQRAALYERAWVFALPSQGEGFGLVYLEAMARQLPCIASRQDAGQEVVQDGVTGYLVDQADIGGLGERLIALLTDEQARRAMGRAGRARVCAHHTYQQFRDRLLSIVTGASTQLTGVSRWH